MRPSTRRRSPPSVPPTCTTCLAWTTAQDDELDNPAWAGTDVVAPCGASWRTPNPPFPDGGGAARPACSRRVPVALHLPGTSLCLHRRAHIRTDGGVAGVRAAGAGIHGA